LDADVVEVLLKHIAHALVFGFVLEDQTNVRYASKWLSISALQRRKQVYVTILQSVLDYFENAPELIF